MDDGAASPAGADVPVDEPKRQRCNSGPGDPGYGGGSATTGEAPAEASGYVVVRARACTVACDASRFFAMCCLRLFETGPHIQNDQARY